MKHPGNRHLSNFQPKIVLSLEKPHVSDKTPGKSPFVQFSAQNNFEVGKTTCFWWSTRKIAICPNFSPKSFWGWKNHMFLTKHPGYHNLSKFKPKTISSLEKPHVSDKAPGKSPFVQISTQNHFEFEKTTCFWQSTRKIAICPNFSPKSFWVWKNHMFLT